jgi:enoyl-CoA hydratase/carnithine racemase
VFPSSARFVVDGAIASLTFNRPEAMNALTWEMYDALAHACDRVDFDRAIRVFIVKGHGGKAFAAGTDISQFTSLTTGEDAIAYERRLDAVVARLEGVAAATIAQVEGIAAGGGCAIAFACDLRVCTPNARFGVPIARTLGNCLSAANCARMLDLVGPTLLKDLLFTGRFMDAAEASRLGLITRMAEPAGVDQATSELAALIVANAPLTIQATKETVRRIEVGRRIDQAAIDDLIVSCYTSGDFRNAVIAFLDKRPPSFTGR